jgi:hypothetical protein
MIIIIFVIVVLVFLQPIKQLHKQWILEKNRYNICFIFSSFLTRTTRTETRIVATISRKARRIQGKRTDIVISFLFPATS